MPSLKDIKTQINSVGSTKKITSAMKMVAASKLRRSQEKAEAARPYSSRLEEMLASLASSAASGEGIIKAIPYFENHEFCPVIALKEHVKNKFVNTNKEKIFKISDKSVALILKKYAQKAGLDPTKYAGHSLRSGFATTAAEFGAEERNIMAMTGHKTTQMVRRYIQEANLFKNNALNKIKF